MEIVENLARLQAPFCTFAPKLQSLVVTAGVAKRSSSQKALEGFIERLDCDFESLQQFMKGRMEEVRRLVMEEGKDLSIYLADELRMLEAFCRLYVDGMRNVAILAEPADGSLAGLVFLLRVRGDRLHSRITDEGREVALRLNVNIFPPRALQKEEPSTNFERTAVKFWLPAEELFGLKLVCGAKLPLDLFLATANVDQVRISSIYFDTPHLAHYARRVRREEGSTLIRLRAYGECPTEAWVEMKTHHESWVRDQSKKERFKLPFSAAVDFLKGDISVENLFGITCSERNRQLALTVQEQISSGTIVPICSTDYHRSAYQSVPTKNEFVRVTIDSQFSVTNLRGKSIDDVITRLAHPESIVADAQASSKTSTFPFSIVETKIHGKQGEDGPSWLNEATKVAHPAPGFSKYQLGVASFVQHSTSGSGVCSPVWWKAMQKLSKKAAQESRPSLPDATPNAPAQAIAASSGILGASDSASSALIPRQAESPAEQASFSPSWLNMQSIPAMRIAQALLPPDAPGRGMDPRTTMKIEPKTHFANERTFIQWHSAALFLVTVAKLTSRRYEAFPSTPILLFLALVMMIYALWRYHWRRWALNSKRVQRFDDPIGPSIMTIALGIAILALFFSSFARTTTVDLASSPNSAGPKHWSHVIAGDVQGVVYSTEGDAVYIAYTDDVTIHLGFTAIPWTSARSYLAKFDRTSGYLQNAEVTHLVPCAVHALDRTYTHFLLGTECGSLVEIVDPFAAITDVPTSTMIGSEIIS